MKNYPGLYQQHSTHRLPTLNNSTHTASVAAFGRPKLASTATARINTGRKDPPKGKNSIAVRQRLSKSIEDLGRMDLADSYAPLFADRKTMPHRNAERGNNEILIENCQDNQELFSRSYQKLNAIYSNLQAHERKDTIEDELAQILGLIKQERATIKAKILELESASTRKQATCYESTAQNTDTFIPQAEQKTVAEAHTQTQTTETSCEVASNQTYLKLVKILEDMNINSRLILPEDVRVEGVKPSHERKYQELKDTEVITVQKFVIKKLVQKLTSLEGQNTR